MLPTKKGPKKEDPRNSRWWLNEWSRAIESMLAVKERETSRGRESALGCPRGRGGILLPVCASRPNSAMWQRHYKKESTYPYRMYKERSAGLGEEGGGKARDLKVRSATLPGSFQERGAMALKGLRHKSAAQPKDSRDQEQLEHSCLKASAFRSASEVDNGRGREGRQMFESGDGERTKGESQRLERVWTPKELFAESRGGQERRVDERPEVGAQSVDKEVAMMDGVKDDGKRSWKSEVECEGPAESLGAGQGRDKQRQAQGKGKFCCGAIGDCSGSLCAGTARQWQPLCQTAKGVALR